MSAVTATGLDTAQPNGPREIIARRPGRRERDPVRASRRLRARNLLLGLGFPVSLLLLWQGASSLGFLDPRLYPSPTDVVAAIGSLQERDLLVGNLLITVERIVKGYAFGAAVAIVVGVLMGLSPWFRAMLEPMLSALYTVPKLALLPIFLTIFGFGELPIVVIIAVATFFFVWISTLAAILAVPHGYREAGYTLNLSRWQTFRHVLLPAALPEIFVGLRIAAGVAVLMLVGVEFVIASSGLGYLIEQGRAALLIAQTYAGIVLIALLGLILTTLIRMIGKLATPWNGSSDRAIGGPM